MPRETIEIEGWRAVPVGDGDDWYIYAPGYRAFRGLARSESAAREWLDEASGAKFARMPAVTLEDARIERGTRIVVHEIGRRGWYKHDVYYVGDTRIGSVQTREINGCTECLTLPDGPDKGGVRGADLRWLFRQSGFRLIEGGVSL